MSSASASEAPPTDRAAAAADLVRLRHRCVKYAVSAQRAPRGPVRIRRLRWLVQAEARFRDALDRFNEARL